MKLELMAGFKLILSFTCIIGCECEIILCTLGHTDTNQCVPNGPIAKKIQKNVNSKFEPTESSIVFKHGISHSITSTLVKKLFLIL